MTYKVVEKFISINGEGGKSGHLAVFIRFAGCNLKCSYCDTMWANAENVQYTELTEDEIYSYIKDTGIKNVTLTGGEPLLQQGIVSLLSLLAQDGELRIEIETNGSVVITEFCHIVPNRPVFTVDYKLPSSGMENAMDIRNFTLLEPQDTVKFVTGSMEDLKKAKAIMDKYSLTSRCGVHLSPVSDMIRMDTMVEYMKEYRMNGVRLQPQLHKIIWNTDMRGV